MLFDVEAADPLSYIVVFPIALAGCIARQLAAGAARAKIDPMVALRWNEKR